jgi:hypothetical protein
MKKPSGSSGTHGGFDPNLVHKAGKDVSLPAIFLILLKLLQISIRIPVPKHPDFLPPRANVQTEEGAAETMATERELIANRPSKIALHAAKDSRVYTQLDETEGTQRRNGFVFSNDEIAVACPEMDTLPPPSSAADKFPWPENGFVFSNDGFLLSIHNGIYPVPVTRPGFQWRPPVSRPSSLRKKRPVPPHYN